MKFRFQAGKPLAACRCGEGFSLNALKRERSKGKVSPSRDVSNPLRADPTRTAGLRRRAESEVNARFSALKADIVRLILAEDALSLNLDDRNDLLLFNAFCPTGKGKGSSNKCAPKRGKGKKKKGDSGSSSTASSAGSDTSPQSKARAGLLARLKGAVAKGASAVYGRMVLATPTMWKAMQLFTDVFDHPDDMKKFGYQPTLGTAGHDKHDALKQAGLPFGTHLASKIVMQAITHGVAFAKKLRARRQARKAAVANETVFNANTMELVLMIVLHAINIVHAELGFEPLKMEELKAMFAEGMRQKGITVQGAVGEPVANAGRWSTLDDRGKVKAFKDWIKTQARTRVLADWELAWKQYGEDSWKKGVARAYDDTKAPRAGLNKEAKQVLEGTKAEFLRTAINNPDMAKRLQALSARVHSDVEGVTDHLGTVLTRLLHDGLQKKQTSRQIARTLSQAVDVIGKARAMTVVRTEIVRSHAEGQLDALEALGVAEVGVQVEWRGNPNTMCPLCAPMSGVVLKLTEARGMIPRHPNCYCAWTPANTGETTSSQKRNKGRIDKAISRSQKEEGSTEWGPAKPISRKRPTRNEEIPVVITPAMLELDYWVGQNLNAFCPTGKGGGIKPTCSPKKKGRGRSGPSVAPYSISKDRPHLTATERIEYTSLFKQQQGLHKKIKGGTASDEEKATSTKIKARLNELSKVAQARAKAGGSGSTGKDNKADTSSTTTAKSGSGSDTFKLKDTDSHKQARYQRDEVIKKVELSPGSTFPAVSKTAKFVEENSIDDGHVKQHGMSHAEKMKEITIDGIRVLYHEKIDPLNLGYSVANALDPNVHSALWKANTDLIFSSQRNNKDSYWEAAYGIPNFRSAATGGDGKIVAYDHPEMSRRTFTHEAGHNLAKKEWGSPFPDEHSDYGKAHKAEKPVSDYGSKSIAEDFAEACALRSTTPAAFKRDFPLKAAALEALLEKHK